MTDTIPTLVEHRARWLRALASAQSRYSIITANTEPAENLGICLGLRGFVLGDDSGGFGIRSDGELVGLFSRIRGRGDYLVAEAVRHGATHLNCFDGYLVKLYHRHGFQIEECVANWNTNGPDVVYMRRFGYNTGIAGGE